MVKKASSYTGTQAVSRALQLLKLFDDTSPEIDLQTLSDNSGLNKSTTFRILTALESEGFIQKTDLGYGLGAEAIVLGGRAMRSNNLRGVSRTHLEALSQKTGETVTLEVLLLGDDNELFSLVIDEVVGRHLVGISQYIGSRLPVHATSSGKALLAFQSKDVLGNVWQQALTRFTKQTLKPEGLKRQLKQIRKDGYALAKGELEAGLMTAAAPIFDVNGRAQAAISLVAPSIRVDETALKTLANDVKESARLISNALGYKTGKEGA